MLKIDVDKYVEELLQQYADDDNKWLKVAVSLQCKLRDFVWHMEYCQKKLTEELERVIK